METELEKIENEPVKLSIGGKEREIKFPFSFWAKIQKEYGTIDNFVKLEEDLKTKPFTMLPHLIWLALSDKEGVTEETVLDDYGIEDAETIGNIVMTALYGSLPSNKNNNKKKVQKN